MRFVDYLTGQAKEILNTLQQNKRDFGQQFSDIIPRVAEKVRPALRKIVDGYANNTPIGQAVKQGSYAPMVNAFKNIGGLEDFRVAFDDTQPPAIRKQALGRSTSKVMGIAGTIGGTGDLKSTVSPLKSLLSEARKYKTAEEFVNSKTVYRSGEIRDGRKGLKGDWFSTTEDYAKAYSDRGELKQYTLKPDAKILSYEDIPSGMKPFPSGDLQWDDFKDIQQLQNRAFDYAKKNGYDAVRWGDKELNIINRDVLTTKSQLTSLWEQAQKLLKKK